MCNVFCFVFQSECVCMFEAQTKREKKREDAFRKDTLNLDSK